MPPRIVVQYPASMSWTAGLFDMMHENLRRMLIEGDAAFMPSKSKAQANMMRAAAHNPAFAKKVGVPQSVAKEFADADDKRGTKKLPARKK
jgi:hypothetical protein